MGCEGSGVGGGGMCVYVCFAYCFSKVSLNWVSIVIKYASANLTRYPKHVLC